MRVLVTGAQGYIGSVLVAEVTKRGHEVVGVDTGFYADGWLGDGIVPLQPSVQKDTREIVSDDLRGFDAVVHLAELSNDPLGALNPKITYEINHLGTVNFAKACKRAGITRFIYSSSCSVYGLGTGDFKTEESEPNPQTAYAKCKVLVECDLSEMADDNFSPTFLRNATAYGPSPRMRFDLVLNNLAGFAWTIGEIRMTSDGTPYRPLVHVRDICEAMICTLEAPRSVVHNQALNVGASAENYQVRDIAALVAEAFPDCHVTLGPSGGDNRSYRVSFDKIGAVLPAFRCRRDAAQGSRELRAVFERIGLSSEQFEFRAFTRVKQLKYLLESGRLTERLFWASAAVGSSARLA